MYCTVCRYGGCGGGGNAYFIHVIDREKETLGFQQAKKKRESDRSFHQSHWFSLPQNPPSCTLWPSGNRSHLVAGVEMGGLNESKGDVLGFRGGGGGFLGGVPDVGDILRGLGYSYANL